LCYSQSGDHPKNNLAKYGYILDMKVGKKRGKKKFKKSFHILGYLLELIIQIWRFGKKDLQNLANLVLLFPLKKPLYRSKSYS
jgi:hypothetical protein